MLDGWICSTIGYIHALDHTKATQLTKSFLPSQGVHLHDHIPPHRISPGVISSASLRDMVYREHSIVLLPQFHISVHIPSLYVDPQLHLHIYALSSPILSRLVFPANS